MRRFDLIILGIILSIWLILSGCQRQAQELSVRAPLLLGVIFYSERDGRGGLYFWDWRTHRIRPFTSYDEVVSPFFFVDWSPVVQKLAYTCGYLRSAEICVRDLEGHRWQLTRNDWEDSQPRWSPDGREIAFLSRRGDGAQRAYRMKADGSQQRPIFSDSSILSTYVVWSPDGQWLVVPSEVADEGFRLRHQAYPVHLYLVHTQTGQIVRDFPDAIGATWSPDGQELAYTYRQGEDYEILVYNLKDDKTRRVVSVRNLWYLEWSTDGQWLAFVAGKLQPNEVNTRLFIIRPDGSERRDLTPAGVLAVLAGPGTWSPDSRYLLIDIQTEKLDIGFVDISNGNLIKITDDEHYDEALSWAWK